MTNVPSVQPFTRRPYQASLTASTMPLISILAPAVFFINWSIVLLVLAPNWHGARAQYSNVTCGDWSSWMLNTFGETPCLVWARIGALCSGENYTVASLQAESYIYTSPDGTQCTPCQCNSVAFSLMSACTVCQYEDAKRRLQFDNQEYWSFSCNTSGVDGSLYRFNGTMDLSIEQAATNAGVSIPIWARLPITEDPGYWDQDAAYQVALIAAATASQTLTTADPTFTFPTATASSTLSSTLGTVLHPSPSPAAVAGGTVGGILLVAVLLALLWFFFRRRRRLRRERDLQAQQAAAYEEFRSSVAVSYPRVDNRPRGRALSTSSTAKDGFNSSPTSTDNSQGPLLRLAHGPTAPSLVYVPYNESLPTTPTTISGAYPHLPEVEAVKRGGWR